VSAAALELITFRSFDDFQNVLGGFFVIISAISEALFAEREREKEGERNDYVPL
jgi:hypothetical protein